MYLKKTEKQKKRATFFCSTGIQRNVAILGSFGGFLFLIILLIILNIMQEHFLVLGLDWPFTEKPR